MSIEQDITPLRTPQSSCWPRQPSKILENKQNNINDIIFLGDFFHVRTNISVNTLYVASLFLDKLKDFRVHKVDKKIISLIKR